MTTAATVFAATADSGFTLSLTNALLIAVVFALGLVVGALVRIAKSLENNTGSEAGSNKSREIKAPAA